MMCPGFTVLIPKQKVSKHKWINEWFNEWANKWINERLSQYAISSTGKYGS